MHITMVKKTRLDGSDCRKCAEATAHLESRGLWGRIDEVIWAHEGDPSSPGMVLGAKHHVASAPFFIVRDDAGAETVYISVLQLIRERLGQEVTTTQQAAAIDIDDIGI